MDRGGYCIIEIKAFSGRESYMYGFGWRRGTMDAGEFPRVYCDLNFDNLQYDLMMIVWKYLICLSMIGNLVVIVLLENMFH